MHGMLLRLVFLFLVVGASTAAVALAADSAVRVTFDRRGIVRTEAAGLADRTTGRAVTDHDPVRIASISKLVVAIGVLRLVEQGRLDLDADVGRWLGYELRNPNFPTVPITLRRLLSHRSSLTDRAGYVIPYDAELRDTLLQADAWDGNHAPGEYFRYTNLNFPIIAAVLERATGERFDRLMRRLVLAPLRLDACFNWQGCGSQTRTRAVVLYDGATAVVDGAKQNCPVVRGSDGSCDLTRWRAGRNGAMFSPQGGLRISARDLSKIGRLLLGEGVVDGVRLLRPASFRTLTNPEWVFDGHNGLRGEADTNADAGIGIFCRYGLALQTLATPVRECADDPRGDGRALIGHAGSAYGLLSGLWIDRDAGTGVAYFVTGAPQTLGRRSQFTAIEERLLAGEPLEVLLGSTEARAP